LEQQNLALEKYTDRSYSICAKTNSAAAAATDDDVISQDTEDAVIRRRPKIAADKGNNKEEVKPKPKERKSKPSKTARCIISLINGPKSDGKAAGGEGNDNQAGDKGSLHGDPYA
jgi:hypothetical protein